MDDEVLGVVESAMASKTKTGKDTYRIVVAGVTYSGFGEVPCRRGDEVKFIFVNKPNPMKEGSFYHNIVNDSVIIKKASTEPMPTPQVKEYSSPPVPREYYDGLKELNDKKLKFNSKKVALQCTVKAMDTAPLPNAPDIIKLAKELEAYLNGE